MERYHLIVSGVRLNGTTTEGGVMDSGSKADMEKLAAAMQAHPEYWGFMRVRTELELDY